MTRQGDYRDPLLILLDRERSSCKGCAFAKVAWDKQFLQQGAQFRQAV
ncbi:hypothetical protein ACFS07_10325 [Undibacterium arcticum]